MYTKTQEENHKTNIDLLFSSLKDKKKFNQIIKTPWSMPNITKYKMGQFNFYVFNKLNLWHNKHVWGDEGTLWFWEVIYIVIPWKSSPGPGFKFGALLLAL